MKLLLIYFGIAMGVSFICSLLEAVLLSISPTHIAVLTRSGNPAAARIARLKARIDRSLASILTLNTIANTVGAAGVGAQALIVAAPYLDPGPPRSGPILAMHAVAFASAGLTLCILVASEIVPKTLGALYWKKLTPVAAAVIPVLIFITYPFVLILEAVSRIFSERGLQATISRDEIFVTAELGELHGTLERRESRIIKNLLLLDNLLVKDIMTPRSVMLAFPADRTVAQIVEGDQPLTFSRLPIYSTHHDEIVGFVTRYRLMRAYAAGRGERKLSEFLLELHRVPEALPVARLFDEFIERRAHIFLAADEYGGTAGIVTLEDAIETLLGVEIVDESDSVEDMRKHARDLWDRRKRSMELESGADLYDEEPPPG